MVSIKPSCCLKGLDKRENRSGKDQYPCFRYSDQPQNTVRTLRGESNASASGMATQTVSEWNVVSLSAQIRDPPRSSPRVRSRHHSGERSENSFRTWSV